jgi:Ca2+-dependent lipid-binding protein
MSLGGVEILRTRTIDNSLDPKWNHVQYIIIYKSSLSQVHDKSDEVRFEVIHDNPLLTKSLGVTTPLRLSRWIQIMGISFIEDAPELLENEVNHLIQDWGSPFEHNGVAWKPFIFEKRPYGSVRFDLSFFPLVPPEFKLKDDTCRSGIITITIMQGKELGLGSNSDVYCHGILRGVEVFRTPSRKRTSKPQWNTVHRFYVADMQKALLKVHLHNKGSSIGACMVVLKNAISMADEWYKLVGAPGKVRLSAKFQLIDVNHETISTLNRRRFDPVGVVRINVIEAKELPLSKADQASMGLNKSDPYCKVFLQGRAVGVTPTIEKTQSPLWYDTFYAGK